MMLRNTPENWGAVAKFLHWAGAALILAMLGLGLTMAHAHLGSGEKFEAYQLHKSAGFFVLAVTLARVLWRMTNSTPVLPESVKPWERRLARALHLALYLLILAMIASGWVMISASPLPIPAHLPFGFTVPNLTGPNALIAARAKFIHQAVSKVLIAAIALHVGAALKLQFADHDRVLSRMLPFGRILRGVGFAAAKPGTRAAPIALGPSLVGNRGPHAQ